MAAANVIVLLSLFILPVVWTGDGGQPLTLVLNAIAKLVRYYSNNFHELNLDGLFGLRVLEGQIGLLLTEHTQGLHQHLSASVVSTMQSLLSETSRTSRDALDFVRQDDEGYYQRMKYVIDKPWSHFKRHRKLNQSYTWPLIVYASNYTLNEETSDQCMSELTGSSSKRPCQISTQCLTIMTRRGMTEYGITHQILWTMLAERIGCGDTLNNMLRNIGFGGIEVLQNILCMNNYQEMTTVVHTVMQGVIKPDYQDLFLEQQYICPSVGFYEFLSSDYLRQILSWQMPSGCFGSDADDDSDSEQAKQVSKMIMKEAGRQQAVDMARRTGPHGTSLMRKKWNEAMLAIRKQAQSLSHQQHLSAGAPGQNPVVGQATLRLPTPKALQASAAQQGVPLNRSTRLGRNPKIRFESWRNGAGGNPNKATLGGGNLQNGIASVSPGDKAQELPVPPRRRSANRLRDLLRPEDPQNQPVRGWPKAKPQGLKTVSSRRRQVADPEAPSPPRLPLPADQERLQGKKEKASRQPKLHLPYQHPAGGVAVRQGRKLLVEKELADGCLSHKMAVGAGALTMYLRYLIDPGPMHLNQTGHILQETSRSLLEKGIVAADSQKVKKEGLIPVKQNMIQEEDEFEEEEEEEEEDADENPIDNTLDGGGNNNEEDFNEDEDEEDDNLDEEGNYKDDGDADYNDTDNNDEMYPENENIVPNDRDRKIVHFGGDHNNMVGLGKHGGIPSNDLRGDDDADATGTRKKEVPDQQAQDDVEYTYYDEPNEESDKKNVASPKKELAKKSEPEKFKSHQAEYPKAMPHKEMNFSPLSPQVVGVIFASSFLLLFFLVYKFIRRRRIHIRYRPKGFFKL